MNAGTPMSADARPQEVSVGSAPEAASKSPAAADHVLAARASWQTMGGVYTYHYHLRYSMLEGIHRGAFFPMVIAFVMTQVLLPPTATTAEKGTYTTLINWLPTLAMLFGPIWTGTALARRRYWLIASVGARLLPSIALAFVTEAWQVVSLVTFMHFMASGIPPSQNTIFARNYTPFERDRFHGLSRRWQIVALIATNLVLVAWLDTWPDAFRVVMPIAGALSALGMVMMYRVRLRRGNANARRREQAEAAATAAAGWAAVRALHALVSPWPMAIQTLRKNRNFAIFELGFMFYGMAFMMLFPVVPVFYSDVFQVNYKTYGLHTTTAFFTLVFLGHWFLKGRTSSWSATRLAGTAFAVLIFYPSLLLVAGLTDQLWCAFLAFVCYGAGMSVIEYAWNYGPLQFADNDDPSPYLRTHAMLVGVRALIAYPLAWLILQHSKQGDFRVSLAIPIALFCVAACIIWWLSRRMRGAG